MSHLRRKLIEVALPLDAINKAAAREKSIRHGHPSTLHLWWARRPLAAARAVIFSQMVDDPSAHPELFPTEKAQEKERQRLFRIIEELVKWENTTNEDVLGQAREEIRKSWWRACAENADHPRAEELFDPDKLPAFHDPFAGGGSLPLEAQRLGLESYASDLNPVAVLINKAMIEIPPKFAGRPPVNPEARTNKELFSREWKGAQGLADDVRYYGRWMRDEAEKRIGHLYPKVEITKEMAKERPDLKGLVGKKRTVIAWLWARTVRSPNPAFAGVDVPLVSTFMLSTKAGKEVYVEPVVEGGGYRFTVKVGTPKDMEAAKNGTKLARGANFRCVMSGVPIAGNHIKAEGMAGRMGARLMAVVADGERGRVYFAPTPEQETAALQAQPAWKPEITVSGSTQYLGVKPYGMERFDQLFTDRQLVALTTLSDLVQEVRLQVERDAVVAGLSDDGHGIAAEGTAAAAYADAVAVYLAFCLDKATLTNSTQATWQKAPDRLTQAFGRQAIPMTWDYAEANPLSEAGGGFGITSHAVGKVLERLPLSAPTGTGSQQDAASTTTPAALVVSTDPPYYDNVPYADLSDYFYVWLRRSARQIFPDLFSTVAVPKAEELVAFAYRHGGKASAEAFFLDGMTKALHCLSSRVHPALPLTIYYAFRQAESDGDDGTASTGWDTFLESVIRAGFTISGTWPMRTEYTGNLKTKRNALASSIVLVCRHRPATPFIATRRELLAALKAELPVALAHLQRGNIAPVDLAQSAIGPGMAVFTRYSKVIEADGSPMSVRKALHLINQTLDECLNEQEGEFDGDTRFAVTWYETHGLEPAAFGEAENLAKARNVSVQGVVEAGIFEARGGKARLLKRAELPNDWDPATDTRLTVWEATQHMIKRLEAQGETGAAELLRKLGGLGDAARDLCYRLYTLCERKKWAEEALHYNSLIVAWPEIAKLAAQAAPGSGQTELF